MTQVRDGGRHRLFQFPPPQGDYYRRGGLVVTYDSGVAERMRHLRNHCVVTVDGHKRFGLAGSNFRLTDFQGALGVIQMGRMEGIIALRIEMAGLYDQALTIMPDIVRPVIMDGARHIWQSYVILIKQSIDRDRLLKTLKEQGIEATIGTYAVSAQPHYAKTNRVLHNSRRVYEQSLCLPLHTQMSEDDIENTAGHLLAITA